MAKVKESGLSQSETREILNKALDKKYPRDINKCGAWIQEIWDDEIAYEYDGQTYKVSYSIIDGAVTFGEPKTAVRKTVYIAIESLRKKYADLIQEVGKRNAASDSERIKKIMALCQELLSSDTPAQESVREAVKECDACLAWLREGKTEDGVNYPAEAFAYVPDKDKPSEWKLRLWEDLEKKVTKAQLGRAAAALSPGGFRGQKVSIPAEDLPAVKRRIRAEYRKLDVSDDDMPKWVKESESRELLADYVPLTEANYKNGEGVVTIIKPGFNSSKGRYYPAEVLARDMGIFEGAKMFADHPTEADERARPERSIKDWVASLGKPFVSTEGAIQAPFKVVEPHFQEKLNVLRDKDMLKEIGVSINAIGSATDTTIEGCKTKCVERLIRARSVDFVTEPGAGGGIAVYESADPNIDIDLIDITHLQERRPDIIRLIESEFESKYTQEVKHKLEAENDNKTLKESVDKLTNENKELKDKLTEAEKTKAVDAAQAIIKEAVAKSQLPEAAKARILDQFKEATSADGVDAAIKAEADYIAKLSEAGKVKGLGSSKEDPEQGFKSLKESFMRTGMSEAQAEIAARGR